MQNCQTVLIRCDASSRNGFGHVVRCVALAEHIQENYSWRVVFAMREDESGIRYATERGFTVATQTTDRIDSEGDWLRIITKRFKVSVLILDVRTDLARAAVRDIRQQSVLVVGIDDISERRLEADLVFYPPIPQINKMDWTDFKGQLFSGWDWIVMPNDFSILKELRTTGTLNLSNLPSILVTMGSTDPSGMTFKVLEAIDTIDVPFVTRVVIGSGFTHIDKLTDWLTFASRPYEIIKNPPSMAALMLQSDFAIASFGATAYELACVGVPAIYLCLTEDHAQSASALQNAGTALNLGRFEGVNGNEIQLAVKHLLENAEKRREMHLNSKNLIDGLGTARISNMINESLKVIHA